MVNTTFSYTLRGVYLVACTIAPFFSAAAYMTALRMNDSLRYRDRFQNGCIISIAALPISFIITCYYQFKYSDTNFGLYISLLPLLPVTSFFICFSLFYKDFKINTTNNTKDK